jgi:histidinol dehydrogenase
MGGAQAIAALAFGAGEVPRVAKICGPGNAWVAEAKTYVASIPGGPAIDMPAGPSELMVIADATANPAWVAADLLSQAEHDASAQVLLVATDAALADAVCGELQLFAPTLPRHTIIEQSLAGASIILAGSLEEAADIANAYAPEHLCLAVGDPAPPRRPDPQRRRGLRRPRRGRDVRRLSRRLQPRFAHRRPPLARGAASMSTASSRP